MDSYRTFNRGCNIKRQNPVCYNQTYCQPQHKLPADAGCGFEDFNKEHKSAFAGMSLAMGYVPFQSWGKLYDPCVALVEGTAFPELNLAFFGARRKCNG